MSTTIRKPNVQHITRLFRTATPEQVEAGAEWYADAYKIADAFATKYDVTIPQAAGVIAALSPLNSWGANVSLAARFLSGTRHSGYLSVGLTKARNILAGYDILETLKSDKISNFYRSILSSGTHPDAVTVDRHAYDIAVNVRHNDETRPSIGKGRYREVVACYVRAAQILSKEYEMAISPAQVQSVTWVLHRAKFWAEGAWDKGADIS